MSCELRIYRSISTKPHTVLISHRCSIIYTNIAAGVAQFDEYELIWGNFTLTSHVWYFLDLISVFFSEGVGRKAWVSSCVDLECNISIENPFHSRFSINWFYNSYIWAREFRNNVYISWSPWTLVISLAL